MVKVKVRVDLNTKTASYELEGTEQEIIDLKEDVLKALNEKLAVLTAGFTALPATTISGQPRVEVPHEELVSGWIEKVGDRPHLTSLARNITLKDQILLALYAHKVVLGKDTLSARAIWEFLREDGFPAGYSSVLARISELTRDAMLIRYEPEGYKLSRAAEERVLQVLKGKEGRP